MYKYNLFIFLFINNDESKWNFFQRKNFLLEKIEKYF